MGQRASFSTKLGVIAATAGSSIGLGNIWRFPYETGQNGGAAFILIYIICVLVLAMPVMMAEFIIGRGSRTNASHAFNKLAPGSWWKIIGYICISAPVIIVGFYFVISGWTLEYVIQSLTPGSMIQQSAEAYSRHSHARGKQRYRKSSQYPDARSFPHSHYFLHTLHIPPRILRRNEFPFQARFLQNYPKCRTEGNGTGIFLDECRHGYTHHIRLILFKRNASYTGCHNRRDFRHPRGHTRRHHHFPYGIYIRHQPFSGT